VSNFRFREAFLLVVLMIAILVAAGPAKTVYYHDAMGTVFELTLCAGDGGDGKLDGVADEAFAAIDGLETRISHWRGESQVAHINQHAAQGPVSATGDVLDLLLASRRFHDETGGAFDVTVGPVMEVWGFEGKEPHVPGDAELRQALSRVGMDKVRLNEAGRTVKFAVEGMQLDFGGIGKGYALDTAAEVVRRHKVRCALLGAGTSSILAMGAPPNESGWKVQIRDPFHVGRFIDEVMLRDQSLSSSGNYEKFRIIDGRKYCHIINPGTGKPIEGIVSASVIAPTATASDALSTAFFVMGVEGAKAYCASHPEVGAIIVTAGDGESARPVRIGLVPARATQKE
jgi:thiamine biosynthesis lipoprotein